LLALDGSLGHVSEVLSGDYYQPLSTSSPHQIWSAAMVVSPLLRGMFGLATDAKAGTVTFAPHLPADWNSLSIDNVRVGENKVQLTFTRSAEGIFMEAGRTAGTGESRIEFRPSISLRATVQKAELNGKPLSFRIESNEEDQHVIVRFPVSEGQDFVRIAVSDDFAVTATAALPPLGNVSTGLRILSETWSASHDQLTLNVSGSVGAQYQLSVWNAAQIDHVDGAELKKKPEVSTLTVQIPSSGSDSYAQSKIVIHFSDAQSKGKRR